MSTEKVTYLLELRDKFSKNLGTANKGINQLDKSANAASLSFGKMRGMLAGLGIGLVAKEIFTAGINMEQTRVAFATFLKDADKGNKVISELNEFSNITPFNNDEVIKSGRVLLAANTPAEKLIGTLKNIGDVAAGAKVPLTDLSSIYGKIMNKGKAQAEELNQMAERGIPILQVLADKFGITREEVMKMGSDGKLSSDIIAGAFQTMASEGGMFFNMMEKQSATAGGKLSTLQGSLGLLAAELGESANPAIGGLLDKLIALTNVLKDNKDTVIAVVKWVGMGAAAFVAYKATVFAVNKGLMMYKAIQKASMITTLASTKATKLGRIAMAAFNKVTKANVIGAVVAGLVLLAPILFKIINGTEKLSAKQKVLNEIGEKSSEIYIKMASKLNVLKSTFEAGNLTQKERIGIIKDINSNYGEYLDNLLTEKSTDEDIAAALQMINEQLKIKAKLQAIEKQILETSDKQLQLERDRGNASKFAEKATEGFWTKVKLLLGGTGTLVNQMKNTQGEFTEEIRDTYDELDELFKLQDEISKGAKTNKLNIPGGAGGGVGLDKKTKKTLETGIRAGAAKMVTINIGNLVESFNIETKQINEAPIRVKEEMTKVLLDAINDASIMQR